MQSLGSARPAPAVAQRQGTWDGSNGQPMQGYGSPFLLVLPCCLSSSNKPNSVQHNVHPLDNPDPKKKVFTAVLNNLKDKDRAQRMITHFYRMACNEFCSKEPKPNPIYVVLVSPNVHFEDGKPFVGKDPF
jgi:hypothetical protein